MVDYLDCAIMNYLGNFYYLKEEGPPEDGPVKLLGSRLDNVRINFNLALTSKDTIHRTNACRK
jgi:hypothetical protein